MNLSLSELKDGIQIIQSLVTITAIGVGGLWFIQKRQRYPKASIKHTISHRKVRDDKLLLSIDMTITNNGNILLRISAIKVEMKQILPPANELKRLLASNREVESGFHVTDWDVIGERNRRILEKAEIEPGESQQFDYHFLINSEIETIWLKTSLQNPRRNRASWSQVTIYDLQVDKV